MIRQFRWEVKPVIFSTAGGTGESRRFVRDERIVLPNPTFLSETPGSWLYRTSPDNADFALT
jgi:hypothetical protein